MNLNAINNNSLEAILDSVFQNSGYSNNSNGQGLNGTGTSSIAGSDHSQLSPLAKLAIFLQQLQQSNPVEYRSITGQIAANLETAAQADQANGNTTGAAQLNQLSADFTSASASGQLPDLEDLAQALGSATSDPKITINLSQLEQLVASLESASSTEQSQSLNQSQNPLSIILNTISGAGFNINSPSNANN